MTRFSPTQLVNGVLIARPIVRPPQKPVATYPALGNAAENRISSKPGRREKLKQAKGELRSRACSPRSPVTIGQQKRDYPAAHADLGSDVDLREGRQLDWAKPSPNASGDSESDSRPFLLSYSPLSALGGTHKDENHPEDDRAIL